MIKTACDCIDKDELVNLLRSLVDINSPTGEEEKCAAYLAGYMDHAGLEARLQPVEPGRANAIGVLKGRRKGPGLAFFGHLDTSLSGRQEEDAPMVGVLPPGLKASSYVKDNKVFGLGSFNMKGGVSCAVAALAALKKAGFQPEGDLAVCAVAGESEKSPVEGLYRSFSGPRYQGAGYGVRHLLTSGFICDAAIECEPTSLYVVNARTGYLRIKISVPGKMGYQSHIGTASPATSAIARAYELVKSIQAWAPQYREKHRFDAGIGTIFPNVNIGAIEAGAPYFPAFIPGMCNLYVEIRLAPQQVLSEALKEIGGFFDSVRESTGIAFSWETYCLNYPGTCTVAESPVIKTLLRARESVLGKPQSNYPPVVAVASSDANAFRRIGIPVATLGPGGSFDVPGGIDMWTGEGEYQDIDGLVKATQIYIAAAVEMSR